jgi:DNA polymerase-4
MVRQILHVDMDAFYVSVEELENPGLIGKPVIVGGDPEGRGVVASASYAARRFGVRSAQPLRTAKRLCPQAIFLRGNYSRYQDYSNRLHKVFLHFTPVVEMASVDEAYLDLTGCERLHGPLLQAAGALIHSVKEQTGLNCSVGASTSHLVSKIASDQAKPHGLLCIFPGCEAAFLAPLPISRMPGVGRVTEPRLHRLGIRKIGDVQRMSPDALRRNCGRFGEWLYTKAQGRDIDAYAYREEPRSISHETTFDQDTSDAVKLDRTLSDLAQRVARRLRAQRLYARTVGVKLRRADFSTLTRDLTLNEPTQLDSALYAAAHGLFWRAYQAGTLVRLVGVRASNLEDAAPQPDLFTREQNQRMGRLLQTADQLRERFGFEAVQLARSLPPPGEYHPRHSAGPQRLTRIKRPKRS